MRGLARLAAVSVLAVALAGASPARASVEAGAKAYDRHDYATSLKLLRPEAERGSARAQYLLGRHYQFGQGVPVNRVEAYYWYRRAEIGGHAEGKLFRQLLVQHWKISRADRLEAERRVALVIDANKTSRAVAALTRSATGDKPGESSALRGALEPKSPVPPETPPIVAEKPPAAKPPAVKPPAVKPPAVAAKPAPKGTVTAKAPPVRVPTITDPPKPRENIYAALVPRQPPAAVARARVPQEHATAVVPPSRHDAPPTGDEHAADHQPSVTAPVVANGPMMDDWSAPAPAYVPPPAYAPPVYAPRYVPAYRPPPAAYYAPAYRPWRPPAPYYGHAGYYRAPAYAPGGYAPRGYAPRAYYAPRGYAAGPSFNFSFRFSGRGWR